MTPSDLLGDKETNQSHRGFWENDVQQRVKYAKEGGLCWSRPWGKKEFNSQCLLCKRYYLEL